MMEGGWIDLSVPLRPRMPTWPDEPGFSVERVKDAARGDPATVSRVSMGVHTGTHMDTPLHYLVDGADLESLALGTVIGPARIVAIPGTEVIGMAELEAHGIHADERLMFKTRNSDRHWPNHPFTDDYVALSAEAGRWLAQRRVRLVGIDYLSIGCPSAGAEVHRALLEAGVWIVEGLDLSRVEPGHYELVCLPLRLLDTDGAPARVVVRRLDDA